MSERFHIDLPTIDQATLTPVLRRALGSETVQVVDWEGQRLHAGAGLGSSVFRLSGQARDQDRMIPWSLILKVVRLLPQADDPGNVVYYWKREVLAYQSGLLDDLPGGLAAPACYGIVEQSGQGAWLWLEEVADAFGPRWPLEHYGVVARHLGRFNGAYLVGRPLPDAPWLSRGWLRAYVEQSAPAITLLRDTLDHPLVRRFLPGQSAADLLRLWEEREIFLDALERLPQTLCHMDAFRRNLFAHRGADRAHRDPLGGQTVAIDWAYTGIGALGEEIVPLVAASLAFLDVGRGREQELEQMVMQGYLQGLCDAGWDGDPCLVHLGYAVTATLRYPLGGLGEFLPALLDENTHPMLEQVWGLPVGKVVDRLAPAMEGVGDGADRARKLLDTLL